MHVHACRGVIGQFSPHIIWELGIVRSVASALTHPALSPAFTCLENSFSWSWTCYLVVRELSYCVRGLGPISTNNLLYNVVSCTLCLFKAYPCTMHGIHLSSYCPAWYPLYGCTSVLLIPSPVSECLGQFYFFLLFFNSTALLSVCSECAHC